MFLALIFTPAHIGLPIHHGDGSGWKHQLETTRNLTMSPTLSWFFVGLDYQVEHHLFPKIPHANLPRASKILKQWCAEVDLPYQEIDYFASVADSTRFMRDAWKIDIEGELADAAVSSRTLAA